MYLKCEKSSLDKLMAFISSSEDCEQVSGNEWVIDIYEPEPAFTLNIVFDKSGIRVDGAEYLSYSDELDGWYMSGSIDSEDELISLLRNAGAC